MTDRVSSDPGGGPPRGPRHWADLTFAGAARDPGRVEDRVPLEFVQRVGDTFLHWSVVEVDAAALPGARGPRCLVFARPQCIRRVWNYPANWRTLDDAALAALSWNR